MRPDIETITITKRTARNTCYIKHYSDGRMVKGHLLHADFARWVGTSSGTPATCPS